MKVRVPYLSRIEGHAHLVVDTEAGEVAECRLEVIETPRFFEKILLGRHYSEVAGLASRICGVCSHSHTLVSLKATENAFGITITPQAEQLRRLLMYGEIIQSHLVHLYFMALPDYLGVNSLLVLSRNRRELISRALRLKKLGSDICTVVGGRSVHPVTTCVGGFHRLPTPSELQKLRSQLAESLPDLEQTVELVASLDWPCYTRDSCYMAIDDPAGYPIWGESLTRSDGVRIAAEHYREVIQEYTVPHSTAKHARAHDAPYQVGPLARFRKGFQHLTPLAREVAELLGLRAETDNPYLAQGIRLVEVLYCVESSMSLIDRLLLEGLTSEEPARPRNRRQGQGTAAVEAPRGTLLHDYEYDGDGCLTRANCVIPTAQNLASLERDLRSRVPQIIDQDPGQFQGDLERLVRAYDPCLSCSTHLLTIERIKKT